VRGERSGVEELGDGLAGEGGFCNFFKDDAGARGAAEGNGDDVAREKFEAGGVSERSRAVPENLGGDNLVKH